MQKKAFTLAEILITLGVIGIIAVLTVPPLIEKYEKYTIETQLKKTYSELENLINLSTADNGSFEHWDYTNKDMFDKYFKPYLKAEMCGEQNNEYCFLKYQNSNLRAFRFANGELVDANSGHWATAPKYLLSDGRAVIIESVYDTTFNRNWKYINFVVDVNGSKGPCVMGWDVFLFTLYNYKHGNKEKIGLKLGSIGGGDGAYTHTSERILENCYNDGGYDCGLLIQRNGWKLPDNYPLKY